MLGMSWTIGSGGVWKNFVTDFGAATNGVSDSSAATTAWLAYAGANDGAKLYIPPGRYVLDLNGQKLANGLNNVTISGYGATLTKLLIGSLGLQAEDYTHSARFQSTSIGATSLTLVTGSEISRFSVGQWILVSGLSMQTFGYPSNFNTNEYRQISGIVGSTISFTQPLANAYLSTWPEADPGHVLAFDTGGPATVYAMAPGFGGTKTYLGLRVEQSTQVTCGCGERTIVRDMTFDGDGIAASMGKSFVVENTSIGINNEVDKNIEYMEYNNCTGPMVVVQSSSVNQFVVKNNSNITLLSGTAQNTTIANSTVGTLRAGPTGYGHGVSLTATNSTINSTTFAGTMVDSTIFSFSNGTFSVLTAARDGPMQVFVPGQKYFFAYYDGAVHKAADGTGLVTSFTVTAIRQDATHVFIDTDIGATLPTPTYQGGQPVNRYVAYAAAAVTQTNSGPADLTQWAAP